jgi:hypothetical protein
MTTGPSNAGVITVIIAETKFPDATGMTTGDVAAVVAAAAPWVAVSEEAAAATRIDVVEEDLIGMTMTEVEMVEDMKDAVEEDLIGMIMTEVEIVEVLTEEAEAVTTTVEVVTAEVVSIVSNEEVAAAEVDTTIKMIVAAIVAAVVVDLIHSEGVVPIDRHQRAIAGARLLRQPEVPVVVREPD